MLIAGDPFIYGRRVEPVTLARRHAIPAKYNVRQYAEAGGQITYGTNLRQAFRQAASNAGRIQKGERPADLQVVQSTKFDFVINLKAAWALGLKVPATLPAHADEGVE
jgi:putative tryptophan/tyrosine transport system substrate-binding protein